MRAKCPKVRSSGFSLQSARLATNAPQVKARTTNLRLLLFLLLIFTPFAADAPRFVAVDIHLDPKGQPLAAYQLDLTATPGAKIVGVEGGDHSEFRKAPYYDPKAIQTERLIVAAFTTNNAVALPNFKTRILTIHLEVSAATFQLQPTLTVAADADGQKIAAQLTISERKQP